LYEAIEASCRVAFFIIDLDRSYLLLLLDIKHLIRGEIVFMKRIAVFTGMFVCYAFLFSTVANAAESSLHIHDSWVREAPPSAKVLAAFLSIKNNDQKDRVLLSVEADGFEKVEMHKTEVHGKMTHMVLQKELLVPAAAGETVVLEPGGYHLMLMKPVKGFSAGDNISLKFKFKDGEIVAIKAVVRKINMGMEGHDHGAHSGH
jgi:copper(I)-binding protein